MSDKPLWQRVCDAYYADRAGWTEASAWQAVAKVATDAERARCLAICDEFGGAKRGDDMGTVRRRIESGVLAMSDKPIAQLCFIAWNEGDDCWDQLDPQDQADWQAAAKVAYEQGVADTIALLEKRAKEEAAKL